MKVIHYEGVPCNTRPGENTVLQETSHWNRVTCQRCLRGWTVNSGPFPSRSTAATESTPPEHLQARADTQKGKEG